MRFRLSTKPTWTDLRSRLAVDLPAAFPAARFEISGEGAEPTVAWTDGPAEGSVAQVLGDVPGWRVESSFLGPEAAEASAGLRPLRLARAFSDAALALAVVRFHASGVRPYAPEQPGARAKLWAILEEDDPATCGYPLTERIRDLLVAEPDPAGAGDAPADAAARWAWKLAAVGYDRLWSRAWATVEL